MWCVLHAEAIAAIRRIQAFLMLPESEQQVPAAEPQAVIVSMWMHLQHKRQLLHGSPAAHNL